MGRNKKDITFDFSTCFGRGKITRAKWGKTLKPANAACKRLINEVAADDLGFWKLPGKYQAEKILAPLQEAADRSLKRFDNLVIIGIGGSALGARMLFNALCHRYHNERALKGKSARVYFMENNDPDSFNDLMDTINLKRTLFNVVSKSGSTAETACQFITVRDRLKRLFPRSWQKHFIFTTDPENGILKELSNEENIETLNVPQDVGGRFSVLSPVGLFPALMMGIDVKNLLRGAERMARRCISTDITANPALEGALTHFLSDRELGLNMLVVFPYADRLRDWTEWFCQLWAESLGKETNESGRKVNAGTTPIKTLGAIDQHSQVQLYMEGPNDKIFMFLRTGRFDRNVKFPSKKNTPEALRYLSGRNMQELIQAEQTATRFALGEKGRISYQVDIPVISADTVGQIVFWAEAMTVFAGYMYKVNPFDQPGVELGKNFAYGLMGRKGFDSYRKRLTGELKRP